MSTPSLQSHLVFEHRENKRMQIERYFMNHLGEKVSSRALHFKYGSSARTRISEINRSEASEITIVNEHYFDAGLGQEVSCYKAVRK